MEAPPNKLEAAARGMTYLVLALAGVWVLFAPPRTIEGTLGIMSTYLWGVLMLPAVLAAFAAFTRRWRPEYWTLPFLIAGTTIYALAIWGGVPDTITRGPQACMITALCLALTARFSTLRRLAKAPKKGGPWSGSR